MQKLHIEIMSHRPAVRLDAPVTLDVLLKITPPAAELNAPRPKLNLGLVLDRSGSMAAHNKINYARDAAVYAVQQLLAEDRVSVTIFDDKVQTLVPNTLAGNKAHIVDVIRKIHPGSSTALHRGWIEGAQQVGKHLVEEGLNRVLLLSDGLANVGETNPDVIASDVHRFSKEGVSTTTMGLGDHYNEDLLEAMASSGDGNYYYIETPQQLADIFQTELQGLMAAFGNSVRLELLPQEGVVVADVLNEFEKSEDGQLKLPNLIAGLPVLVVLRLNVPPMQSAGNLCRFRLSWISPQTSQKEETTVSLQLPTVTASAWDTLAANVEVQEQVALMLIARLKKEATRQLEQGDPEVAKQMMQEARQVQSQAPQTPEMVREAAALDEVDAFMEQGDWMKWRKMNKYYSHQRRQSKPYK